MNDNQNYFVTRSTSRVLSEPGGKSSVGFLFGGGGGDAAKAHAPAAETTTEPETEVLPKEVVAEDEKETADSTGGEEDWKAATAVAHNDAIGEAARIKRKNESQHFSIFGTMNDTQAPKESSNAFASAATTNSYNVLTDRPTSRVLRPPGGQSSIQLG